jgi:hypothetical protein
MIAGPEEWTLVFSKDANAGAATTSRPPILCGGVELILGLLFSVVYNNDLNCCLAWFQLQA